MPLPAGGIIAWLPSRVEYLSPQGILLPRVYGTIASSLWLELRGPAARQATASWAVIHLACHRLLPCLQVTFAMVPDAARPGSDKWPRSTALATGPAWLPQYVRPLGTDLLCTIPLLPQVCAPVRCPAPPGACSPVLTSCALCVPCEWPLGAC